MRRVKVMGNVHELPDDQEHIIQAMETDRPDRSTTYRYKFPASPGAAVQVQKRTEHVGVNYRASAGVYLPAWETMPSLHINEFLLVEPDREYTQSFKTKRPTTIQLDKNYYGYGIDKAGIIPDSSVSILVDMPEAEERFLASLAQKKTCAEVKQTNPKKKKGASPIAYTKEAYQKYSSGEPHDAPLGSFEQELVDAPEPQDPRSVDYNQEEEEDMRDKPRFFAGTRVIYRHPRTKRTGYGTIVGRVPEMRGKNGPEQVLIATDESDKYNGTHIKYTGRNHGVIVNIAKSGMSEISRGEWHTVPEQIGVFVPQAFTQDSVKIPQHATGRILTDVHNGMLDISWNFTNNNFHGVEDSGGTERHNVWTVPATKINMCLLHSSTKKVKISWPNARPGQCSEKKRGDLCTVRGRSVSVLDSDDRESILSSETVVELLKNNGGSYRTWSCKIIGGCADNLLNKTVNIRGDYLREHPAPDNFYRPDQQVEIVAVVDFRKKPLQGMKGRVILSTDREGDVGIEFKEDIGAGSLDGIGKEGHCIYIEASLVKASE
ncbi:hypothetical protein LCGC14_0693380 [marine sediment metagenome]|uniref:Uncharacterized protein n=1 Tax=marine sediment metagenome TaxID=412755 RepID=A0A0F9TSS9_9ZZZZ